MTATDDDVMTLSTALPDDWKRLFECMLEIRYFEDEVKALFGAGVVRGSTHLCQGQEGVVVGVCSALRPGDTMTCTYRGHGAVLAMGASIAAAFGEILGKSPGLCGGKGGSMHFADFDKGILGSNAIVGGHLPIAVGASLAADYLDTGSVSVAFTGDGSTNIGAFHESLNLASIWRLPVIFIVENNHYGEYSPLASTTPVERLADRATSYAMPGVYVDGNDVVAVRSVATTAIERARAGQGPTLIEADTYRQEGHSRSDPAKYRPAGELDAWLAKDPIKRLERAVLQTGAAGATDLAILCEQTRYKVRAALDVAKSWQAPLVSSLGEEVFQ